MGWSKNVLEERDAPDQIILGAFNSFFCCLLGLAIYLEVWKELGLGNMNKFLLGDHMMTLTTTKCGWLIHEGMCGNRMNSFTMQQRDPLESTLV